MSDRDVTLLLQLTEELLSCISTGDWSVYQRLCDPSLTAFEPEALGHLVEGLEFHRYYFELARTGPVANTIASPHVRLMGDTAVVCYFRLLQVLDEEGRPQTRGFEETRIWRRIDGQWRHVHFHRSANGPST